MVDDTFAIKIGVAIRSYRSELGLSQERFADSIAMHRAYYSSIERGEKNITLLTLARLADGLGVRASKILDAAGV